jgi:polysaccharide pyruvyl transferase CsaB
MRTLLSGYYGKGNGGDEALLATLLQMLPPSVTPVILSGTPEETRKRYGVETYQRFSFSGVIKAIASCDVFIWGGGSLIQDVTSTISPFYYEGLMMLAQMKGMKTIAWAQGIGPITKTPVRLLAKANFRGCTSVSVRDTVSSALLSEWNIPHTLAPDPVWALTAKKTNVLSDLPSPRIALTLRSHSNLTESAKANLTQALIKFQKITQAFIVLLPFQKSEDLGIAEEIHGHLKEVSKIIYIEDPLELKGVYQSVDMTIGMRLHSLIMAASEGCRCFAISYDPKVNRLMEQVDMPGWDLSALPDDPEMMANSWLEVYQGGNLLSLGKIQSLVNEAQLHREVLRKALVGV